MLEIYKGSSKDVSRVVEDGKEAVKLTFTDRFSVFDVGPVPYEIEGMGWLRWAMAVRMFQVMEKKGIPNHFIRPDSEDRSIIVQPFNIYQKDVHFDNAAGKIMPFEVLDRQELTKPLLTRAFNESELMCKIRARVDGELKPGALFSSPLIEFTTKYEEKDRRLTDEEAIDIAGLGKTSFAELCDFTANASWHLTNFFGGHNFNRKDGKWEIAITYDGPRYIVADSYTQDEMRLEGPYGSGSHDKDPLRGWYHKLFPGWVQELKRAQEQYPGRYVDGNDMWPKYPKDIPSESILNGLRMKYWTVDKAIGAI